MPSPRISPSTTPSPQAPTYPRLSPIPQQHIASHPTTLGAPSKHDIALRQRTGEQRAPSPVQATDVPHPPCPTTAVRGVVGTVSYMAPEVREGRSYGYPADLFSLGLVFAELLLQRRVSNRNGCCDSVYAEAVSAVQHATKYSFGLRNACLLLLKEDPSERPSAREFRTRLLRSEAADTDMEEQGRASTSFKSLLLRFIKDVFLFITSLEKKDLVWLAPSAAVGILGLLLAFILYFGFS